MTDTPIGVGLRIKTAKAVAVAVSLDDGAPNVLDRSEVRLCDPRVPHSNQPFRAGLESALGERDPRVIAACASVRSVAAQTVPEYLRALGSPIAGVALVVTNLNDPSRIGNDHVRAHALEGQLFYRATEAALTGVGTVTSVVLEKDAYADGEAHLTVSERALREEIAALGKSLGTPWRADHKVAYIGARIALAAACQQPVGHRLNGTTTAALATGPVHASAS